MHASLRVAVMEEGRLARWSHRGAPESRRAEQPTKFSGKQAGNANIRRPHVLTFKFKGGLQASRGFFKAEQSNRPEMQSSNILISKSKSPRFISDLYVVNISTPLSFLIA